LLLSSIHTQDSTVDAVDTDSSINATGNACESVTQIRQVHFKAAHTETCLT